MRKRERTLVLADMTRGWPEEAEAELQQRVASTPEAARFTDQEAEEFLLAALLLDFMTTKEALRLVRLCGLTPPKEIHCDRYRLGRFLFRRWLDPRVKRGFQVRGMQIRQKVLAQLTGKRSKSTVSQRIPAGGSATRFSELAGQIGHFRSLLTPGELAEHQATLAYCKLQLWRFLTEPEILSQTLWEQQKLIRRIHLRDVQLRQMQRSRHHLKREQAALLARLREIALQEQPELKLLAAELEALRTQRAEAEVAHRAARDAQALPYQERITRLQSALRAAEMEFAQVLGLRRRLLGRERGDAGAD